MSLLQSPKARLRHFSYTLLRLRNRHFLFIDLVIFCITPAQAVVLRTDHWSSLSVYTPDLLLYTLLALVVRLTIFHLFGLYHRFWRYASSTEIARVVTAMFSATTLVLFCFLAAKELVASFDLPSSIPLIDALLALMFVTASRASIRLTESLRRTQHTQTPLVNVAIMGAGHTGELIAREIQNNQYLNLCPIAFLDDDPAKQGMQIRDIPVVGGRERLPQLIKEKNLARVIIAMPTAPGREVRKIVEICRNAGIETQTIPGLHELINGTVSMNHLRNVQIEDLLRREPIQTDTAAMTELIKGKRVMVTGGGGSIGSELCRQILRYKPAQLILVGHGENSVFVTANELQKLQMELQEATIGEARTIQSGENAPCKIVSIIADLRFAERMMYICEEHRPHLIFHAAAHKHVPLMEAHPCEAITNNVLGTQNLLKAAQRVNVERFVMISTDKAVNPTSVMGASKRVAELLVHQAAKQCGRPYMVVRFGNVLGSRGSVVHTFKQQIATGGPVTVTHPDMVRYFMTIPEAVQLTLQASALGQGGEVFMLDMGQPVRIVDLARDLIELSGFEVGRDIEIAYSGMRPGEKLFEEMFTPGETYGRTRHNKVLVAANACKFIPADLDEAISALIAAGWRSDDTAIVSRLKHLLPEYQPPQPNQNGGLPQTVAPAKPKQTPTLAFEPLLGN
ncbi:MAG: nucleoside-diphosphate sugar epimerase/dehydratase [Caldilineaceae bacterium]